MATKSKSHVSTEPMQSDGLRLRGASHEGESLLWFGLAKSSPVNAVEAFVQRLSKVGRV